LGISPLGLLVVRFQTYVCTEYLTPWLHQWIHTAQWQKVEPWVRLSVIQPRLAVITSS